MGIPASGVTTTAYRTVTEYTATSGQTTFSPPSYTVGYIDVYRNGVRLGTADFTASNGTSVVLGTGATTGDLIALESFYVSSVLNALPSTGGTINAVSGATPLIVQSNGTSVLTVGTNNLTVNNPVTTNADVNSILTLGRFNSGYPWSLIRPDSTSSGFEFRDNPGNALLTVNTNGIVALKGGSAAGTGTGIAFPASMNASSDANTLDDYEEGTWTPTYDSGTISSYNCTYTKIGRVVHVLFQVAFAASGTSLGRIGGMPFNVATQNYSGTHSREWYNTGNSVQCITSVGSSYIDLFFYNGGRGVSNGSNYGVSGTITYNT
jgi:hypothetical protein